MARTTNSNKTKKKQSLVAWAKRTEGGRVTRSHTDNTTHESDDVAPPTETVTHVNTSPRHPEHPFLHILKETLTIG